MENEPRDTIAPAKYPLELDGHRFRELSEQAARRLAEFLDTLPEQPSCDFEHVAETARAQSEPLPAGGGQSFAELLDQLFTQVFPKGFNTAGPGYMAYIPGGGLPHAAIADLISMVANRYVGLWSAAPVAAQIEATVVRWLCEIVGYNQAAGGFLTSGGSLANWSALVVARQNISLAKLPSAVVYTSHQSHRSVVKAATLVGILPEHVRMISTDKEFRLSISELQQQIDTDRRIGLVPLAVVANAGTTNTGAVDDLDRVAEIAGKEAMWLHVDASYGGFFLLTERGRAAMQGISRADSIAVDPHKGLFLPYGTGGLVVRDRRLLRETFHGRGEYMTATASDPTFVDFCDISPELTREFRGLRIWLPIKMHGIGVFRECLDEKLDLAEYAAAELRRIPGMHVLDPQLSIVAFRWEVPKADRETLNAANRDLIERINASRRVYLSGTLLDGYFTLRLCILSFRTHRDRIDECLSIIRDSVEKIQLG